MQQPLDFAILSMLRYQPMTGYGLKKALDERIGHIWSTTQSHIYKSLNQLESEGLVSLELVPQSGKPDRKVYSITSQGKEELEKLLVSPLGCDPIREAWLVQLFFAHPLSNEEIKQLFLQRMASLDAQCEQCIHMRDQDSEDNESEDESLDQRTKALRDLTYAYGEAFYQFQKKWHQKAITLINDLSSEN